MFVNVGFFASHWETIISANVSSSPLVLSATVHLPPADPWVSYCPGFFMSLRWSEPSWGESSLGWSSQRASEVIVSWHDGETINQKQEKNGRAGKVSQHASEMLASELEIWKAPTGQHRLWESQDDVSHRAGFSTLLNLSFLTREMKSITLPTL